MPKYRPPKISTDQLTIEEQRELEQWMKYREEQGYSTRMIGQQEAFLIGFAVATQSIARKVGETLHDAAKEIEELGNQF